MIARGAAAILKVGEKRDRASNRSALARGRRGGGAAGGRATTHGCRGAGEDLASCSPPPAVACSAARRSPRAQWTAAAADGVRGFEGISSLSPLCRFSLLLCSCRTVCLVAASMNWVGSNPDFETESTYLLFWLHF